MTWSDKDAEDDYLRRWGEHWQRSGPLCARCALEIHPGTGWIMVLDGPIARREYHAGCFDPALVEPGKLAEPAIGVPGTDDQKAGKYAEGASDRHD